MANIKDFLLPDLGEGLTEGEIVNWLVAVGDTVQVDQPVAEVETAKAVVEVPSPFAGTVTALHGEAGQEVEVGRPLITIDTDGGPAPDAEGAAPAQAGTPEGPAQAEAPGAARDQAEAPGAAPDQAETPGAAPARAEATSQSSPPRSGADVTDMVPAPADVDDEDSGSVLVGYGTGRKPSRRRRGGKPAAAAPVGGGPPAPTAPEPRHPAGRPLAKPPVRKLAKDLGVDLTEVAPSGEGGIVTRDDVLAFAEGDGQRAVAEAPARPSITVPAPQPPSADLIERLPVKGVRKAVAERMTISRREIPEAAAWVDVDATGLVDVRDQLAAAHPDVKVTPLAIILRVCVAGLQRFPEVNSRLDTETNEIVIQRFVNLGVAVQTDAGLMVPVIHRADGLTTLQIAAELDRVARGARDRSLTPAELSGSTFTISNYGAFGVDGGSAVINHPEAAILGVGRVSERPWMHNGEVEARKVLNLSIAFDHRVCDGAEAAGFLRYVADLVESPARMLGDL